MTQNHTVPTKCGLRGESRAFWSLHPVGKLLFFVHGFGGSPVGTFRNFPKLLLEDIRWAGWDMFYYGYDAAAVRAGTSARLLQEQISRVIQQPNYSDIGFLFPRNAPPYEEIWFVVHSLGAPVLRRALLNLSSEQAVFLPNCRLICFAPATCGARIERLMADLGISAARSGLSSLTSLYLLIQFWLRYRLSSLDDLKIGSRFLKNLQQQTRAAAQGFASPDPFRSRGTFFGTHERVVDYPPAFVLDEPVNIFDGRNHIDVCKPRSLIDPAYQRVLQIVKP